MRRLASASDGKYNEFKAWIDSNASYLKDGATYKTLNMQGRVPIGVGTGTDSAGLSKTFNLGAGSGENEHKLTVAELPPHQHLIPIWARAVDSDGVTNWTSVQWNNNDNDTIHMAHTKINDYSSSMNATHRNNIQPSRCVNFLIRVMA